MTAGSRTTGRRTTAVAAPHPAAVAAAGAAVRQGGNAIDAALAAAAVLTVVYPHQCALGGDLIALARAPGQDGATAVLSVGAPPAGLDIDALAGAPMPRRGIRTVTVPGVVAGWSALAGLGAALPLGDALTTAAVLASNGIEVSAGLARGLTGQRPAVLADPGLRAVFAPSGAIAGPGDVIRTPSTAVRSRPGSRPAWRPSAATTGWPTWPPTGPRSPRRLNARSVPPAGGSRPRRRRAPCCSASCRWPSPPGARRPVPIRWSPSACGPWRCATES
jgi:hypothetical protein